MQTIFVKSITNLAEARYCAGMMVELISFELDETNPDFVNQEKLNEIRNWISGVKIIGQNKHLNATEINQIILDYNLNGFLFDFKQRDLVHLVDCEIKILEIDIEKSDINTHSFNYIVAKGDIQNHLQAIKNPEKTLLGYDFENINLEIENLKGFAFKGGKETRPGQGEYEELIETLEILEN